ncbi:hypothetical protein CMU39_14145 [Elizabethkingia anophelis]|nr:hypothetical protein [Elizabethkingia anophelis]
MFSLNPENSFEFYNTILVIIFNILWISYNVYCYRKKERVHLGEVIGVIIMSPIFAFAAFILLMVFSILWSFTSIPTLKRK